MITSEFLLFWSVTLLLAAGFFFALTSLIFGKGRLYSIARVITLLAYLALTALGTVRWIRTGHPPFVTQFESLITSVWFVLTIFHILSIKLRQAQILLLPLTAVTFLLLGWSSSMSGDASPLSAALTNVWLFIHASFATSGAAAFVTAASFGAIYLLGEKKLERIKQTISKVPEYSSLPSSILNFLIFGLILWGVMIVSGSIWAHVAWGRYWAWDPIELWSLISWLLYGLLLHARLTFKLSKRLFSWLTIIAALTILFALWGVQYIYETIHTYG